MKNHEFLKPALSALAKVQIALEKEGGPSENGQLFEYILDIQSGILKSFGLPETQENESLLWFKTLPIDTELDERIKQLHKVATEYLLSNSKPELEILREAQETQKGAFSVLPELKVSTHVYTIFVYDQILLKHKDSVENILHELKITNRPEILQALGLINQGTLGNQTEVVAALKSMGLKHIDAFFNLSKNETDMSQSNQLLKFLSEINGEVAFNSNEERFLSLTNCLMNYLALSVGKNIYRITECEIYYYSSDHPDPYVHQGEEQMTAGKLYLNKVGGLDITFGRAEIPAYGGILIRGIRNMKTNEYISQVQKVTSEVFVAVGNIITEENGIHLRELMSGQVNVEQPIQSTRIGLTKKTEDVNGFLEKSYRYIVDLNVLHKFKDKEKVVKQLLAENKLSAEDAKTIMGYNLKG